MIEILKNIVDSENEVEIKIKESKIYLETLEKKALEDGEKRLGEIKSNGKKEIEEAILEAVKKAETKAREIDKETQEKIDDINSRVKSKKEEAIVSVIRKVVGADVDC